MATNTGASADTTFARITLVALGILWLLFVSIVTYVEIDTRSSLQELQGRIWQLEQKVIVIEIRQQGVLTVLDTVNSRMRDVERLYWTRPGSSGAEGH
jgi:hypothetical protein